MSADPDGWAQRHTRVRARSAAASSGLCRRERRGTSAHCRASLDSTEAICTSDGRATAVAGGGGGKDGERGSSGSSTSNPHRHLHEANPLRVLRKHFHEIGSLLELRRAPLRAFDLLLGRQRAEMLPHGRALANRFKCRFGGKRAGWSAEETGSGRQISQASAEAPLLKQKPLMLRPFLSE